MFEFNAINVAQWTSSNGKWIVFAHAIADTMADGQVIGYNSRVTVYQVKDGEYINPNMNKLPKYIQGAIVYAQEALTARLDVLHEELQSEIKEWVTNEPPPPQFIYENCMTCDNSLYAREVMEYTGKVMETPFILDDGTKLIEYEYLYKCYKCGSLLWEPEDMARENATDREGIQEEAREQQHKKIERHNAYYFAKIQQLNSVTDVHKYHKRVNRLSKLSLLIGELELQYIRSLRQRWDST